MSTSGIERHAEDFFAYAHEVIDAGRLRLEAGFVQHGSTSTLLHSLAVAACADTMARVFGCTAYLPEIRRAALLHDYYLYDWHERSERSAGHAANHAARALANAIEDYPDLTERERDAIRCHMFPINPVPPRYSVGWFVTCADKICASHETFVRSELAYPTLRRLAALYMPDVDLGVTPVDLATVPARQLAREGAR